MSTIPYLNAKSHKDITSRSKSSFLAAFGLLSKKQAEDLSKVYAFCRIADDCVDEFDEPDQQRQALNFWKDTFEKTALGESVHPVFDELFEVIFRRDMPLTWFRDMFAGCERDITQKRYQTYDDLLSYCDQVSVTVGYMVLRISEYQASNAGEIAINLGRAIQLTNILRDIKEDLERDRIYLARNDIRSCQYSYDKLETKKIDANFHQLIELYVNRAKNLYEQGEKLIDKSHDQSLKPAHTMAKIYRSVLTEVETKKSSLLEKKVSLSKIKQVLSVFHSGRLFSR